MKKDINYVTIDGRGEHDSFRDCVTKAIKELKPNEGIHVIKDFEPFPMYKMMEEKGFDKFVEKVSDEEYHAYFYPIDKLEKIKMTENLDIDEDKINKIIEIKLDYIKGNISIEEAKKTMKDSFEKITAQEFAICEQYLQKYGISDDLLAERMDEILEIFDGILVSEKLDLPSGHPVKTYLDEISAIREVLSKMKKQLGKKFIKNQWLELYDKLAKISIHFSRKQNQLFPALESKGFDKPSKVMWTLDNNTKEIIRKSRGLLEEDKDQEFLKLQEEVMEMVEDMMVKEEEILLPTSMDLLSDEDFVKMRKGDDEIGYCLIKTPAPYGNKEGNVMSNLNGSNENDFMKDMAAVLQKHGMLNSSSKNDVLDVAQGKLTLSQINLIFKHLQVDLSYVDENEIVKFYSDTKHRVFPRSAGVIGREVQNCHPRESVHMVEEIIRAFREGEQDEAEFWLEINGKFIYIIYNAVRDEEGNFKGVLEMMQDVTKIRSLTGTQRLLSWTNEGTKKKEDSESYIKEEELPENEYGITKDSNIGEIVKKYPYIKNFLVNLSPKFSKLKNPILFKTMSSMATIEMIAQRGDFETKDLLEKIVTEIDKNK
ncbi:PAS domain-containing protein [Clostridium intestinale]|uniref:PAS domain-containing protein n=1 Tax=Clostridium intestinale TaxID=36845 RepID=UPI002DD630D3|nr:PAS domain-containing protein [Clostridium intestinale]WRY51245.1 PAS domain-containing protein [Clostridium intestinale]